MKRLVLAVAIILAGCTAPQETETWKELGAGEANIALHEQVAQRFRLEETSLVRAEVTHVARNPVFVALARDAACTTIRNEAVEGPAHYYGAMRTIWSGTSQVEAVLPAGEHCLVGAPDRPDVATAFSFRILARPAPGREPAEFVEASRVPGTDGPGAPEGSVRFAGEPWSEAWLAEAVAYYRDVGFFAAHASDEEAAAAVRAALEDDWGSLEAVPGKGADRRLLGVDAERVWWEDLEQDVLAGNDAYVEAVAEWGAISRGLLDVGRVEELWETEEGPVQVRAVVNGTLREFEAESLGDYYDGWSLQQAFNAWTEGMGVSYVSAWTGDQTMFVTVLTPDEQARLERERGWSF